MLGYTIKMRILEHVFRIHNNVMEAPLTEYFLSKNHDPNDLKFFITEKLETRSYHDSDKIKLLHQKESF